MFNVDSLARSFMRCTTSFFRWLLTKSGLHVKVTRKVLRLTSFECFSFGELLGLWSHFSTCLLCLYSNVLQILIFHSISLLAPIHEVLPIHRLCILLLGKTSSTSSWISVWNIWLDTSTFSKHCARSFWRDRLLLSLLFSTIARTLGSCRLFKIGKRILKLLTLQRQYSISAFCPCYKQTFVQKRGFKLVIASFTMPGFPDSTTAWPSLVLLKGFGWYLCSNSKTIIWWNMF